MTDREFWLAILQALLMLIDALERYKLPGTSRTADLRKQAKQH